MTTATAIGPVRQCRTTRGSAARRGGMAALVVAQLGACAGGPPPPDWKLNAHAGLERSVAAYLEGDSRVATLEFERARAELARSARIDLLARAELTRCAARVASLEFEPCAGFERWRPDAAATETAYADYLLARLQPQDVAALPPQQRGVAAAGATPLAALQAIADPLSRLVAAGVLLQTGRASPQVMALAVDTASAQGWRRPLLAWLKLQAERAEQAGASDEAARLRRRIALVLGPR